MINENDIVLDLYKDIIINIENIKSSKIRLTKIKNDINRLDNNFFYINCNDDLFNEYLNMFDETETYSELLRKLETLKNQTEYHIKNKCEHQWEFDDIDIDPDRSQRICYCVKCELTKK